MGADGGTIPKRCELVRKKKKVEKIDRAVRAAVHWKTCQLSQEPLKKPIVACKLGRLYNKEEILKAKLNKTLSSNETTKHIKSLSDVKELRLTDNQSYKGDGPEHGDAYIDVNETQFVCPVTALGMNGINNFLVNWNCGCVVSEKAIHELKSDLCNGCGGPYNRDALIMLYPSEELAKIYEERIANGRLAKKAKRASDRIEEAATSEAKDTESKQKAVIPKREAGVKRKAEEVSIQDNPNVSKAVKSMFTTSEQAKNQKQGNWITHDPRY